jgi:hypothetical protein
MIIRFTIGPFRRKAWDSNPHPRQGARISSAARQAVSGYLPTCQWTHPELNWDLRHARAVSSPWTMSPCCRVDRRGLEPRSPGCKPGVLPLDEQPAFQRSVRELNPTLVLTKDVCCHNTYRPSFSVIPAGIEPSHLLGVIQASLPLDHGIMESFLIFDLRFLIAGDQTQSAIRNPQSKI